MAIQRIVLGALALSAARLLAAAACSPTLFVEAPEYPVGASPQAVAVADFNGDTFPDIATASSNGPVSVILNNGDGTFAAPIDSDSDAYGYVITAADFDDDGHVDLAVGAYSKVSILLGDGIGGFADPVLYTAGNGLVRSIAAVNLDPGGALDLAVVTEYTTTVAVLLGDGNGTFGPAANFPAGGSAWYVVAGDFDSNDVPDLVVANSQSNTVTLLLGFGDGTFAPPESFVAGSNPRYLAAADFDGDGDDDIAVTAGAYLSVLKGNGSGGFGAAHQYPSGNLGDLVAGDFTGDGILDFVSLGNDNGSAIRVVVLAGDGDARFDLLPSGFLGGPQAAALAAGDLDGDGRLDVAVVNYGSVSVSLLFGSGGGAFNAARSIVSGTQGQTLTVGDYDGDGILDFAVGGYSELVVQLGDGAGGFSSSFEQYLGYQAIALASGDFTRDGILDLIVMSHYYQILFLKGRGDGTFEAPIAIENSNSYLNGLTTGDFNGDGDLDLAVARGCCGEGSLGLLPGHGDGTFGPSADTPMPGEVMAIVPGDFDAGGAPDLALTVQPDNEMLVLLNAGDGTFLSPVTYATESVAYSVAAGDVTGDGVVDLVTANYDAQNLSIFAGAGDGTFGPSVALALGHRPFFVAIADVDGDGIHDLATADGDDAAMTVFLAQGDGDFAPPHSYATDSSPRFIESGDFVLNGHADLIVATSGTVDLFANSKLGVATLPSAGACVGEGGVLHAFASGFGPLSYQWRKDGVDLTDGGHVSGATTSTLAIQPADATDEGDYDVVMTDLCTTVPSNATTFSVSSSPASPVIVIDAPPAPGVAGTASVAATPGHTYAWTIGGDTEAIITSGQGTAQITFLAALPGHVTLDVTDFAVPGCGAASGVSAVPVDFYDVPAAHPFHADIVKIARAGITAGCGSGQYCPDAPVTRAQMSIFLLKGRYGSDWFPDANADYFIDVPPGSFAFEWINYLAYRGITGGCGVSIYCPDNSVTRSQMAVFILKTLDVYYPPFSPQIFDDVPQGAFAWDFIDEIYNRGITGGCSVDPKLYCPNGLVNRGQMAVFIVRAFLEPAP